MGKVFDVMQGIPGSIPSGTKNEVSVAALFITAFDFLAGVVDAEILQLVKKRARLCHNGRLCKHSSC